jgi:predicted HTH domain antitoxin
MNPIAVRLVNYRRFCTGEIMWNLFAERKIPLELFESWRDRKRVTSYYIQYLWEQGLISIGLAASLLGLDLYEVREYIGNYKWQQEYHDDF